MKIVVCAKRVPDTGSRLQIAPDGASLDKGGLRYVMNPYDEFALEVALRLRERVGEGEVIVLSLGDEGSQEVLRGALAAGADRALLLLGESGMDGLATAKALLAALLDEAPDLVLLGVRSVDGDQGQVGPMLATLLGWSCLTQVAELSPSEGGRLECVRETEEGRERLRLSTPAVLAFTKGAHELRSPNLKGIMAAKKKPLDVRSADVPPGRIRTLSLELPPERKGGRIVGEGAEAVPELVRLLREEAGVL